MFDIIKDSDDKYFNPESFNSIFKRDMIRILIIYCVVLMLTHNFLNIYEFGIASALFIVSCIFMKIFKCHPFSKKYMSYVIFFIASLLPMFEIISVVENNTSMVFDGMACLIAGVFGMFCMITLVYAFPVSIVGNICLKLIYDGENNDGVDYNKSNKKFCLIMGIISAIAILTSILYGAYEIVGINLLAIIFLWVTICIKYRCDEDINSKNMMAIFKFTRDNWIHLSSFIMIVLTFIMYILYIWFGV